MYEIAVKKKVNVKGEDACGGEAVGELENNLNSAICKDMKPRITIQSKSHFPFVCPPTPLLN